jgi:cytoskeletal protein CcmA (bactofilin family)
MMGRKNKKNKPRPAPVSVTPQSSVIAPAERPEPEPDPLPPVESSTQFVNIGRSIQIKGELNGNEDLTIDGKVEGIIRLRDHNLTVSANGHITAEVFAKSAVIYGQVIGDVRAEERIEIADGGTVEGDLIAPKVVLADGARFKGRVDMLTGCDAKAGKAKEVWGESVEASAFDEAPGSFADEVIDEIIEEHTPKQESNSKKKDKKGKKDDNSEKAEKVDGEEPKLSSMFEEFDPANP